MKKIISMIALLLMAVTGAVAQTTYNVTVKDGTEDAANWTANPNPAAEDATVTIQYNGTKKVKSVTAVKKAAAAASGITNPVVGQVIGSDGKNYATKADAETAGATAVAMIAYVSGSNGLAIALSNEMFKEEETMDWTTATTTAAAHTPAFAGCTWGLPSKDDWENMFNANGGSSGLNDKLDTAGGNSSMLQEGSDYWSSTEKNGDEAYYMNYDSYYGTDFYSAEKTSWRYVRAVFAF